MTTENNVSFTPADHALLFAWIGREVVQRVGEEKGEAIMRKAVARYARQRGQRMALRAQANGHALTMTNYLQYGEWRQADPDSSASETIETQPHLKKHVHQCPWNTAWVDNDLIPTGRFYCLEVDAALLRGFNPDLTIEVNSTKPNNADYCEFVFHDAEVVAIETQLPQYGEPYPVGESTVMPWDYHIGHLAKTLGEDLAAAMGEAGKEAMAAAMAQFGQRVGTEAVEIIMAYQSSDFEQLPE